MYQTVVPVRSGLANVVVHAALAPRRIAIPGQPDEVAGESRAASPQAEALQREQSQRVEQLLERLQEVGAELHAQQRQRLREMQEVAVELGVSIASHVLQARIEADDFPIEEFVRRVVNELEPQQPVTVHLHPEDLELLAERAGENGKPLTDSREIAFVADAGLARGDCRAETGDLHLVSRLSERLAGIRGELLEALGEAELERRKTGPGERSVRRFPDRRQTA